MALHEDRELASFVADFKGFMLAPDMNVSLSVVAAPEPLQGGAFYVIQYIVAEPGTAVVAIVTAARPMPRGAAPGLRSPSVLSPACSALPYMPSSVVLFTTGRAVRPGTDGRFLRQHAAPGLRQGSTGGLSPPGECSAFHDGMPRKPLRKPQSAFRE